MVPLADGVAHPRPGAHSIATASTHRASGSRATAEEVDVDRTGEPGHHGRPVAAQPQIEQLPGTTDALPTAA